MTLSKQYEPNFSIGSKTQITLCIYIYQLNKKGKHMKVIWKTTSPRSYVWKLEKPSNPPT